MNKRNARRGSRRAFRLKRVVSRKKFFRHLNGKSIDFAAARCYSSPIFHGGRTMTMTRFVFAYRYYRYFKLK